jgi:dTDP-4-amino-4,6-dideoxygalactose transaminase
LTVIEDAAQAIGATYYGRLAGGIGTITCFSFFPTKNLGVFDDAGLVTATDAALAARVRRLRNHGSEPKYVHQEIGGNFRLDALQAAVVRVKLKYSDGRVQTFNQFVVRLPDRDRVRAYLGSRQVSTEVYYPVPFNKQPCFQRYVT